MERNDHKRRELMIYEKHYVGGVAVFEREVTQITVWIHDTDSTDGGGNGGGNGGGGAQSGAQCKSINDPHTTTFDGL